MPNQASMIDVPTLVVILCLKISLSMPSHLFGIIFGLFQQINVPEIESRFLG
jgi:hypothetical protein